MDKRKEFAIRMCDICIKLMQDEELTDEEFVFAYKYFKKELGIDLGKRHETKKENK